MPLELQLRCILLTSLYGIDYILQTRRQVNVQPEDQQEQVQVVVTCQEDGTNSSPE